MESKELDCDYILGARMRSVKEISERVLADRGRYQEITPERKTSKDPSPLKVKEVTIEDRRYIVCLNEEQRRKDAADRQAIVEHLREQLKRGDKDLIGNKGYRKYLQVTKAEHFTLMRTRSRKKPAMMAMGFADQPGGRTQSHRFSLQGTVDGRGHVPHDEIDFGNTAHLSQTGRDHSRSLCSVVFWRYCCGVHWSNGWSKRVRAGNGPRSCVDSITSRRSRRYSKGSVS